jgi:hypothetical protein
MPGPPSTGETIAERKARLPLPEDPPTAPDWNSADARTVNISSGGKKSGVSNGDSSTTGLQGAATKGSGVREEGGADLSELGRQAEEGQGGLPKDATKD